MEFTCSVCKVTDQEYSVMWTLRKGNNFWDIKILIIRILISKIYKNGKSCTTRLSISWFSKSSLSIRIDNNIKLCAARFHQVRFFERSAIFRTDISQNTSDIAQNMKFSIKDYSVNVAKFPENCGFGHIYGRNL